MCGSLRWLTQAHCLDLLKALQIITHLLIPTAHSGIMTFSCQRRRVCCDLGRISPPATPPYDRSTVRLAPNLELFFFSPHWRQNILLMSSISWRTVCSALQRSDWCFLLDLLLSFRVFHLSSPSRCLSVDVAEEVVHAEVFWSLNIAKTDMFISLFYKILSGIWTVCEKTKILVLMAPKQNYTMCTYTTFSHS